jgi:hypothetical protein
MKNSLNFVNNFSEISAELISELQDSVKGVSLDDKARSEINELADALKNNFDKVVHHGRRADESFPRARRKRPKCRSSPRQGSISS